jgi:hypothetical protein
MPCAHRAWALGCNFVAYRTSYEPYNLNHMCHRCAIFFSLFIAFHLYAGGTNDYVWQPPWGATNRYTLIDAPKADSITNGINYGQVVANLGPGCVGVTENVAVPRWYFSDGRVLHAWPANYRADDVLQSRPLLVEGHLGLMTAGTFYFETNTHPPAPYGGEQVVFEYVHHLMSPKAQFDSLRGVRFEDMTIVDTLPGYQIDVTNLLGGNWLASAQFDSWIYPLLDGTNTVGVVRLREERRRDGKWRP